MGHFSLLYGYINAAEDFFEENRARIATLPKDDTWPYLTRDLFAAPKQKHSHEGQLITFGTMYNGVEQSWEEWLSKFENLLRTMYWSDAHVFLQTECWGTYHYVWECLFPWELEDGEPNLPVKHWRFSGGPRSGCVNGISN